MKLILFLKELINTWKLLFYKMILLFIKPHPEPLLKCIEKLNLKPEEVIYIGDAQSDYEASKNAHIDFGLAKWGSVATQEIPATLVFKQPKDLLRLLKK